MRCDAVVLLDRDVVGSDLFDDTGCFGTDHVAGVDRGAILHAGADERRLGTKQRHSLALHVRAHERTVGVVVLEERDQRRGDRPDLPRRDVHEVDVDRVDVVDLATPWCAPARALRRTCCPVRAERWPGR